MFDHGELGGGPTPDTTGSTRAAVTGRRSRRTDSSPTRWRAAIDELVALDPDAHRRRRTGRGDGRPATPASPPGRRGRRVDRGVRRPAGVGRRRLPLRHRLDRGPRPAPPPPGRRRGPRRPPAPHHARHPGGLPGRRPLARPTSAPSPAWPATPGPASTSPTAKPSSSARRPGPGSTTGPGSATTGATPPTPTAPNNAAPATTTYAASPSTPASTASSHPDGYLTTIANATVGGALERLEQELFDADWAAAKALHGDATTTAHLARTPAQRRHDALVDMAERAMAAPADAKRPAPLVTVLVDYPTLAGRVCELAGSGTVVAPGDILELLARDDTLIERAVFDGANQITDISRARTFRGTLRRILDLTHRRCDHDTCFVPAHRCQGDHVVPWTQGGPTSIDNGRLTCGPHNRWYYNHEQRQRPPPPAGTSPTTVPTPTQTTRVPAATEIPRTADPGPAGNEHVDGDDHLSPETGHGPPGAEADGVHAMPAIRARARRRTRHRRRRTVDVPAPTSSSSTAVDASRSTSTHGRPTPTMPDPTFDERSRGGPARRRRVRPPSGRRPAATAGARR